MCNIAGYAGTKPAAPILLEMLKKQEGLDSGFFTGIATIHEGKIYYAKVVGDIDTLLERTDAASLPGTIGIAHSRTPGGDNEGDDWAHPFTTERDGNVLFAQVLNGWLGHWTSQLPEYMEFAKQLIADGYPMKSAVYAPGKNPSIDGNTSMHTSDIFTQLTAQKIDQGADAVSALRDGYAQMPEEFATLALSVTEPDAIVWGRMNFPMFCASAQDGMYLATAPQALPEESDPHHLLPATSVGTVYKDHYTCYPIVKNLQEMIAPITPEGLVKAHDVICQALRQDRQTVNGLFQVVAKALKPAVCPQAMPIIYETLWELNRQGRLVIERESVPGMFPELTAPKLYLRLKEI